MTHHSSAQIEATSKWIADYIAINREVLQQFGILASEIRRQYMSDHPHPLGWKTLGRMLRDSGLERFLSDNRVYYTLIS